MSMSKIEYNLDQLVDCDVEEHDALHELLTDPGWGPTVITEAMNDLVRNKPEYHLEMITESSIRRFRKKKNVSKEIA